MAAPRGNSTYIKHQYIYQPGVVYQCDLRSGGSCVQLIVDPSGKFSMTVYIFTIGKSEARILETAARPMPCKHDGRNNSAYTDHVHSHVSTRVRTTARILMKCDIIRYFVVGGYLKLRASPFCSVTQR